MCKHCGVRGAAVQNNQLWDVPSKHSWRQGDPACGNSNPSNHRHFWPNTHMLYCFAGSFTAHEKCGHGDIIGAVMDCTNDCIPSLKRWLPPIGCQGRCQENMEPSLLASTFTPPAIHVYFFTSTAVTSRYMPFQLSFAVLERPLSNQCRGQDVCHFQSDTNQRTSLSNHSPMTLCKELFSCCHGAGNPAPILLTSAL